MFLDLHLLKSEDLGSKRRILRLKQSGKRPKYPWVSGYQTNRQTVSPGFSKIRGYGKLIQLSIYG